MNTEPCPGCGAYFPSLPDAPIHPYIGASAGCWALYTPLLAGQIPDAALLQHAHIVPSASSSQPQPPDRRQPLGNLLVDAYAAQHHGDASPQAVQSVAVHLLVLHGVLIHGLPASQALWIRRRALRKRGVFTQLSPPPLGASLTLRHLFPGGGVDSPATMDAYVASVYAAWAARHSDTLFAWYAQYVLAG